MSEDREQKPASSSKKTPRSSRSGKPQDPLIEFCRGLPGATEDVKWGHDLVFSVGDKMFAAFGLPDGEPIGMKVDPVAFASLTQQPGIIPAPYMARHSWINVISRDALPAQAIKELIRQSHALVAEKLPRKVRAELGLAGDETRRRG
jgi:predicted DNA-binding protein (MmcQ/YjbR family)